MGQARPADPHRDEPDQRGVDQDRHQRRGQRRVVDVGAHVTRLARNLDQNEGELTDLSEPTRSAVHSGWPKTRATVVQITNLPTMTSPSRAPSRGRLVAIVLRAMRPPTGTKKSATNASRSGRRRASVSWA